MAVTKMRYDQIDLVGLAEFIRDTMGLTFAEGAGIDITVDDAGNVISIAALGSVGILDPRLGVPQGTNLRTYQFNTDVEAWAASAAGGTVAWDSGLKAVTFTPPTTSGNYAILDPGGNVTDGEFVVDMSATLVSGTNFDLGLIFRYVDDNNHYMLAIRSYQQTNAVTAILYKKVAGTYTVLSETDTLSAHEMQLGLGARFRAFVRFVGGQISWYINEAFVGAVSDTTFTAGGKLGVRAVNSQVVKIYGAQAFTLASTWEPNLYGSAGSGGAGSGVTAVQDEGSAVPARSIIDFVGSGVTATDDAVNGRTLVTIPGGGAAASGMIEGVGIGKITVSSSTPSSPTVGDVWYKRS